MTLDTHFKDYLETPEGKKLPVEHCIKGTEGWQPDTQVAEAIGGSAEVYEKAHSARLSLHSTLLK